MAESADEEEIEQQEEDTPDKGDTMQQIAHDWALDTEADWTGYDG